MEGVSYDDLNKNGSLDAGEPGLAGAMFVLQQASTEIHTAYSNAAGLYRFSDVSPGQYLLVQKSPPSGYLANGVFELYVFVYANRTLSGDAFNVGHQEAPTPTPTATITATPSDTPQLQRVFLPVLLH